MRVLIADDNSHCCELLALVVEQLNWTVDVAENGARALTLLKEKNYDILLLDLQLPDMEGFEVLKQVRKTAPHIKVMLISGCIGVAETVQAMQLGASDCIAKPFNVEEVREKLTRVAPALPSACESTSEMVAVSLPMRDTTRLMQHVSRSQTTTVLITGETGTGKEVIAQRLHKMSERKDKAFVAVNCSAIPASLIESELFGHERGAFTDAKATRKGFFEVAGDGTIFLDEIGDMSLELQSKLLRVLQERSFRRVGGTEEIPLKARVIAATHVDLAAAVHAGKFREDLYYRLAVIPIHLRPLRERADDILPLAERFIQHFAAEMNCPPPILTPEHKGMLLAYSWPGNVRELKNVIERFVLLDGRIEFVKALRPAAQAKPNADANPLSQLDGKSIDENERKMIYEFLLQKLLAPQARRSNAAQPAVV